MKKSILYLSHRIPYPPNKGDKIRSFNEIRYLSERYVVDLIALADEPGDLKYSVSLEKYCRKVKIIPLNKHAGKIKGFISLLSGQSISQRYFYKKEFQAIFDEWTGAGFYDALICFSSPMAEYVFRSKNKIDDIAETIIMDFCDLDSDKWRQYAGSTAFPWNMIYGLEAERLLIFEKKINHWFDRSIFISQKEADLFIDCHDRAENIRIIPNGVDYQYFNEKNTQVTQEFSYPMIVFAGAMDYYANIDGVLWFSKEILPRIKKEIPGINFFIVGSNPDPCIKALEKDPGITVTGFVEDIREYYKAADICIIPLRIARGIQNKVLEAMSMGKPVISTSQAVQGLRPEVCEVVEIQDLPTPFSQKVINIIENPKQMREMGSKAADFVVRHYDWDKNLDGLYDPETI